MFPHSSAWLLLALLAVACGSARKELERAAAYEREGMFTQAFDTYSGVHDKRPADVQAHAGMQRAAQAQLQRMEQRAREAYAFDDLEAGDRQRQEAMAFAERMQQRRLDVQPDRAVETRRTEAAARLAERLMNEAAEAYRAERFVEAEELAARAYRLDPQRKDAGHLQTMARAEPIYREGLKAEQLQQWREAYRRYDRVVSLDAAYRDALERRDRCRESASYTVSFVPILNASLYTELLGAGEAGRIESQLAGFVREQVLELHDPFIILVDRDHTEEILAEQRRQMGGGYDDRSAAQAGRLLGARYVLTGRVVRFDDVLKRQVEAQMQLIETETGRILKSEVISVNRQEIGRGNTRSQLLERLAKRMANSLQAFAPAR
jgi:tetratricopeptide (TPR) repeat protein